MMRLVNISENLVGCALHTIFLAPAECCVRCTPYHYLLHIFWKFRSTCNPCGPLFSGWNWTP